jgi:hypothetical protein
LSASSARVPGAFYLPPPPPPTIELAHTSLLHAALWRIRRVLPWHLLHHADCDEGVEDGVLYLLARLAVGRIPALEPVVDK